MRESSEWAANTFLRTSVDGWAIRSAAGKATRWWSTRPTSPARHSSAARAISSTSWSDSSASTPIRCSIDSPSRIHRRGIGHGPESIPGSARTNGSSSTRVMRATTRSATCCAEHARPKRKLPRRKSSSSAQSAAIALALVASFACGGGEKAAPQGGESTGPQLAVGLGEHHHPISTTNPEAQKFFDQGFALVYAFNHEEAARAFAHASALDPKAAMPYWGVAWAVGPNYNLDLDDPRAKQAFEAIATAKTLAASGPAHEREYIDAMAVRYSGDPKADRTALAREYSRAMGELSKRHPDDLDAATLFAESLMNLKPWKL